MAAAPIRGRRERVVQTLAFEALGLLLVTPLYGLVSGSPMGESLLLLVVLSGVVMSWAAFYNTVFDRLEWRHAKRVASDRPARLRMLHAIGLEATALLVTWPVIVALTDLDWLEALLADIGLTLTYAAYAYLFHWGFDRLRPVRA